MKKDVTPTQATKGTSIKKKWYENPVYVILWLIFFFPVGIYGLWKYPDWTNKTKWIITGAFALLVIVSMISSANAAPTLDVKEAPKTSLSETSYKVEGSVIPSSSTVSVNGVAVTVDSLGNFTYEVALKDGPNEIIIIAINAGKETKTNQIVTKLSEAEIAKIKAEEAAKAKAEADKKAAEEAEAAKAKAAEEAANNVSAEFKSALSQATSYANSMHMSKQGVYDQLVSEYGGQFSAAAAKYAIDNVEANWNANALAKAKDYQDTMSMSPAAIHDQLTSDYGEKFTKSEADYAIKHLND